MTTKKIDEREAGVWTPWGDVLCVGCNNGIKGTTVRQLPVLPPRECADDEGSGTCDACDWVSRDISNAQQKVRQMAKLGVCASLQQTGGMCIAVVVFHPEPAQSDWLFACSGDELWDGADACWSRFTADGEPVEGEEGAWTDEAVGDVLSRVDPDAPLSLAPLVSAAVRDIHLAAHARKVAKAHVAGTVGDWRLDGADDAKVRRLCRDAEMNDLLADWSAGTIAEQMEIDVDNSDDPWSDPVFDLSARLLADALATEFRAVAS